MTKTLDPAKVLALMARLDKLDAEGVIAFFYLINILVEILERPDMPAVIVRAKECPSNSDFVHVSLHMAPGTEPEMAYNMLQAVMPPVVDVPDDNVARH